MQLEDLPEMSMRLGPVWGDYGAGARQENGDGRYLRDSSVARHYYKNRNFPLPRTNLLFLRLSFTAASKDEDLNINLPKHTLILVLCHKKSKSGKFNSKGKPQNEVFEPIKASKDIVFNPRFFTTKFCCFQIFFSKY